MAPALTVAQYQVLLFEEIKYPDGHPVSTLLPIVWQLYQDKAVQEPRLQYLYAKRELLNILIQHHWEDVHFEEAGVTEEDQQITINLQQSVKNCTEEILASEKRIRANRPGVVASLLRRAPIMRR